MFVWSNLTQLSISRTPQAISSHLNLIKITNKRYKNFAVITFFSKYQFWGEAQRDDMVEGNYYSNYEDYSTISNKHIFKGIFSSKTTSLVYKGYFQNGLPHFIGSFKLNKSLVYKGYVKDGYPHGKGKIYYSDGNLMFSGMVDKGFPIRGVYYDLPKIYRGGVSIKNKSSYKFSFRRLNLMAKSLQYEKMMNKFILNGKVFYSARSLECAEGIINMDSNSFNGKFKMTASSGHIYHGFIKDSKMLDYGFMKKGNNSMKFMGKWSEKNFEGILILPKNYKNRTDTLTNADIETVSRYEEVKKILNFNENVKEVHGNFKIKENKLFLNKVGKIIYEDGSVYKGMVKKNQMHGYGEMKYSTGESYKGTWKCNQIHGIGEYKSKKLTYRGQFHKGVLHGFGILNYDDQIIKGEWKKGKLIYAMIDEFENKGLSSNQLKKDRLIFKVLQEPTISQNIELKVVGPCQVRFTESSSSSVSKPDCTIASSKKTEKHLGSRSLTDLSSSKAMITDSHIFSAKTGAVKNYSFLGEFVDNDGENEFFKDDKVIGYGYLISGKRVILIGIVNLDFSKFYGIKFDYESQTEIIGCFNEQIELIQDGVKSDGVTSFEGTYKEGKRDGLIIETEMDRMVSTGYYKKGFRHGVSLIFDREKSDLNDLREYVYGNISRYYR